MVSASLLSALVLLLHALQVFGLKMDQAAEVEKLAQDYQKKMDKYKDELSRPVFDPLPDLPDPKICAPDGSTSYYHKAMDRFPEACPVPLSKHGLRLHRRRPRANQTVHDIVATSFHPSDPRSWSPWTHPPECGANTNYCVFTTDVLPGTGIGQLHGSGAQGLSVITTAEMAAEQLHLHELELGPGVLAVYDVFRQRPRAVEVRPTNTSKGEGVFAVRPIRAGELVVLDRPALLAHFKVMDDEKIRNFGTSEDDHGLGGEFDEDRARLWNAAVDRLPDAVAASIRHLHVLPRYRALQVVRPLFEASDKQQERQPPTFSQAESLFASNSFSVDIKGYPFKALFPNLAKFNHDCRPNVVLYSSEIPMTMSAWATRDIAEGEELTISYLDDLLPSDRRAKAIQRRWGFTCQCDLCTDRAKDVMLFNSDERRRRLPEARAALHRHFEEEGDTRAALQAALEVRDIYLAEGLMRPIATVGDLVDLPLLEEAGKLRGLRMADPFGPPELAGTLAQLYLETGNYTEALPQLRAAASELGRCSFGWPDEQSMRRMQELEETIAWLEGGLL